MFAFLHLFSLSKSLSKNIRVSEYHPNHGRLLTVLVHIAVVVSL